MSFYFAQLAQTTYSCKDCNKVAISVILAKFLNNRLIFNYLRCIAANLFPRRFHAREVVEWPSARLRVAGKHAIRAFARVCIFGNFCSLNSKLHEALDR